jgi:dCMP deaminase
MTKRDIPDWDTYWFGVLQKLLLRSRDESTQTASVIVYPDNSPCSMGYNSFPRKVEDKPERQERPEKYFWFEHGERNAIYNAARKGHKVEGCTIYVPGMPCSDCARGIIQSGIAKVITIGYDPESEFGKRWAASVARSEQMFREAGVEVIVYPFNWRLELMGPDCRM